MFKGGNDRIGMYGMGGFDDGMMEWGGIVKGRKGGKGELKVKGYDKGYGDFERCCGGVGMVWEVWGEGGRVWFREGVIRVWEIWGRMRIWEGFWGGVCRRYEVEYLEGSMKGGNVIGWCGVWGVKGWR